MEVAIAMSRRVACMSPVVPGSPGASGASGAPDASGGSGKGADLSWIETTVAFRGNSAAGRRISRRRSISTLLHGKEFAGDPSLPMASCLHAGSNGKP